MNLRHTHHAVAAALVAATAIVVSPQPARAHCDAINGPVVTAARQAIETDNITPLLRWVKVEHEQEVRDAFARTLSVRKLGPEARELSDRFLYETVVRLHRIGEGEGFTGLKPADNDPGPAVIASDKALEGGSADEVAKLVTDVVNTGIRSRLKRAMEARNEADRSVENGRRFVAAYVEFVHYVKRLYDTATDATVHIHGEKGVAAQEQKGCNAHGAHGHAKE